MCRNSYWPEGEKKPCHFNCLFITNGTTVVIKSDESIYSMMHSRDIHEQPSVSSPRLLTFCMYT